MASPSTAPVSISSSAPQEEVQTPPTATAPSSSSQFTISSGSSETQGPIRPTMEDAHLHFDDFKTSHAPTSRYSQLSFYAVYDGHGGVSFFEQFLKLHFSHSIIGPNCKDGCRTAPSRCGWYSKVFRW